MPQTAPYDPGANVVASADASLRIVGASEASDGQRFRLDVQASRPYQLFRSCDLVVVAKPSAFGSVIASAAITMSKWRSTTHCSGEGSLYFPLGWSPVGQTVVLEVYEAGSDPARLDPGKLLGYSMPLYLTDPNVYTVPASQDLILDVIPQIGSGLFRVVEGAGAGVKLGLTVAVVAGGAYLAWPLLQKARKSLD